MRIKNSQSAQDQVFKLLIDHERKTVLLKLQELEKAIMGLQYESKVFSFSHIRKIEEIVNCLRLKYRLHADLDDKIIFPFLSKHIPRLSPTLQFLTMETQDFQRLFQTFDKIIIELKGKNRMLLRNSTIEHLRDKGIYLICLIKSHIQLEEDNVYKSIFKELHQEERDSLRSEIEAYLIKHKKNSISKISLKSVGSKRISFFD